MYVSLDSNSSLPPGVYGSVDQLEISIGVSGLSLPIKRFHWLRGGSLFRQSPSDTLSQSVGDGHLQFLELLNFLYKIENEEMFTNST